ncbi:hypothetical protein Ga0061079_1197 [Apibacter mensalis]|uniref:Lipoprotein n=1 Tax=Apibacter mensalis TaxID=1586267 RepID=A0A0X3ART8_9FLAO|nr:hypothetical protein [Apibacter mensalis]CVK17180.1 hypothetical protein Ga0061079_1197 [Apibacter mensalis]
MKKVFILLMGTCSLISCLKIDCDKAAQAAKERECLLIIEQELSTSTPYLNAKGRNLLTKEPCECKDEGRWWVQYREYMSVGDTLIKRKGELVFYIHKKDTILSFPWGECEGKIYE